MESSKLRKFLLELKREKGITQKKLADEMGIQQGIVSEMASGKRRADRLVEHLREHYGYKDTSNDNNIHQVPIEQKEELFTETKNGMRYYRQEDGQLLIEVPLVPHNVLGSPDDEFAELLNDNEFELIKFNVDKIGHGKYYAFKVDGDSMDNGSRRSFQRGDIVLVRELDRDDWMPRLHISRRPFWVICWGNNVRLKQILSQNGTVITLHSLNTSPEYTDFQLDLSDVSRLFDVIKVKPKDWNL